MNCEVHTETSPEAPNGGVLWKKIVLKNSAKFIGKHLCQSLFLRKVSSLRGATLLKKNSGTGAFMWILRNFLQHLFYDTSPVVASAGQRKLSIFKVFQNV